MHSKTFEAHLPQSFMWWCSSADNICSRPEFVAPLPVFFSNAAFLNRDQLHPELFIAESAGNEENALVRLRNGVPSVFMAIT